MLAPVVRSSALQPELPAQVNLQRITQHGSRRDAAKGARPPVARERGLYWLGLFRPHALDTAAAHARKKIALCLDTRKRGARRPVRRPAQMREVSRVGAKACTRAARKTRITRAAQRLAPRPRASQCHASPWAGTLLQRPRRPDATCCSPRSAAQWLQGHGTEGAWRAAYRSIPLENHGLLRFRHRSVRWIGLWGVLQSTPAAPLPLSLLLHHPCTRHRSTPTRPTKFSNTHGGSRAGERCKSPAQRHECAGPGQESGCHRRSAGGAAGSTGGRRGAGARAARSPHSDDPSRAGCLAAASLALDRGHAGAQFSAQRCKRQGCRQVRVQQACWRLPWQGGWGSVAARRQLCARRTARAAAARRGGKHAILRSAEAARRRGR